MSDGVYLHIGCTFRSAVASCPLILAYSVQDYVQDHGTKSMKSRCLVCARLKTLW